MEVVEEEIEVLTSIFQADLKRLGLVWGFPKISLVVKPHMSQGRDPVEAEIEVTYCAGYPAKVPGVKIVRWQGISEENAKRLQQELQKECSRLASPTAEPFVFDLTRVVQDFLVQFRVVTKSFYEEFQEEETNRNRQVLEQKKKLQEQEALRNASLHARVNQALVAPVSPAIKPQAWDINFVSRRSYGEDRLLDEAEPDLDGLLKASAISKSRYHNDFEEIKMLGFGGFGKVVKARNRLDGRLYAVKRIKLEKQDANSNRKILREVTSLAKMFHQNIVRYYQAWIEDADGNISDSDAEDSEEDDDWGGYSSSSAGESSSLGNSPKSKHRALLSELDTAGLYQDDNFVGFGDWSDDGSDSADEVQEAVSSSRQTTESPSKVPSSRGRVLYIQMEYCPGETLREVIDKGLLVENPDLVWKFFRQIIEALWYIHDTCHFIHRDLKPANVFLDENGNVKLGDFGLAVTVQKGAEAKGTGVVEGVPNPTNSNSSRTNNTNYNSTTTTSPAGKKASNDVSSNHEQATSTTKKTKNRKKNKKTNASKTPLATTQSPTTSTTRRSKAPSVENTSGVGTTLYRAPEVLKGKYDEKCDMWSLGIMLYEMLVPPFETGMERIRTLTELRETGKATSGNLKKEARDLVEMLLQKKPKNRPSALSILESGRLPQKIETEKKYFDEVMRIVKGSNRSLPLYTRLMETLFSQVTRDEIFYTYDADILKYTNSTLGTLDPFSESKGQLRHQEILHAMQKLIYREMEKQFEIFGASPFYAPLLTPKTDIETDRQNLFCQLMDPQGTVVLLPMNLTRPFARWVALRQLSWMKRFDCSRVYVAAEIGNNLLGGQPRSKLQGSLDVIVPMSLVQSDPQFSHAWHADAIRCSVQALVRCSKSSTATDVTVFIHDAKLQDALLKSLDLGERSESIQLCSFLDALFSNEKISWVQVRKRCLEKLSQKQTDSLRALFANRQDNHKLVDIYAQRAQQESAVDLTPRVALLKHLLTCSDINCVFRPWLAPIPDMNSGLFYAIVMKRPIQKGSVGSSTAQGGSSSQTNSHPRKRRNHSQNSGTTTRKATTTSSSGQHSHVPQTVCTLFQDSHVFVAATGGRYDSLIRQYQLTSVPRTQVAALGTRFHVERIAMQLIDPVVDLTPYTTLVLVASPCDEEPTCLLECAQLADQLRSHAIPADWMHPFPTSPAQSPISETFLNYCRSNRIPFFVNKRRGQVFRIRVVTNTGIDKDFPKLDQLINFIKSKIPELLNAKE